MFWCCWRSTVRSAWYPQWRSVVVKFYIGMNECWRCEGVVLYQCCHEFTHYCVMEYKNLKKKMLPSPHFRHYCAFFSMTMKILILPRWKSFSGHVFYWPSKRPEHSRRSCAKSVPGSVRLRAVYLKLEDILSTRILYIFWIKSRVYSFLQSFI